MRMIKYPDTSSANFGAVDGELFAGDLTASGKPVKLLENMRGLNSKLHKRARGYSNLAPLVEGPVAHLYVEATPNTQYKAMLTLRGMSLRPFESKIGITAGKTYLPTGTSTIVDERGDVAFSFRRSSTSLSDSTSELHDITTSHREGVAYILFENRTLFFVVVVCSIHHSGEYSLYLFAVSKVKTSTTESNRSLMGGNLDIEYLGKDEDGRNVMLVLIGNNMHGNSLQGLPSSPERRMYVIRETGPETGIFQNIGATPLSYSSSSSENTDFYVSLSNCAREYDSNGRITGFALLANQTLAGSTGDVKIEPYLDWVKFQLTTTGVTKTEQRVEFPSNLFQMATLTRNLALFQASQWVSGNKLYAVVTPGRQAPNSNANIPILVIESELNGLELVEPKFTQLDCAMGMYYTAFVDPKLNQVWWLSDRSFSHNTVEVRHLDVATKSFDYGEVAGGLSQVGLHNGSMLVVTRTPNSVNKWVLSPSESNGRVHVTLDKDLYGIGDRGEVTVNHTLTTTLHATLELTGAVFLDGSSSRDVVLSPGIEISENFTVQSSVTATVTNVRVAKEIDA